MGLLSREDIFAASALPRETVPVPEWGGEVIVQGLTGEQRDLFEQSLLVDREARGNGRGRSGSVDLRNARAKLVALSIVNEDGERMFSDADVPELGRMPAVGLQRIYRVAQRLSGLSEEEERELLGNSAGGPPADMPSDSPNDSGSPIPTD